MSDPWILGGATFLVIAGMMLLHARYTRRRSSMTPPDREPSQTVADSGCVDLGMEIKRVLAGLTPLAQEHGVTCTVAIGSRLITRTEPNAFRTHLSNLVQHAIGRTPNGSVLVSAGQHGERMRVAVSDDGPFNDTAGVQVALQPVSEFLIQQGGSLEIDDRPGEGMTITMRLPAAHAVAPAALPLAGPDAGAILTA